MRKWTFFILFLICQPVIGDDDDDYFAFKDAVRKKDYEKIKAFLEADVFRLVPKINDRSVSYFGSIKYALRNKDTDTLLLLLDYSSRDEKVTEYLTGAIEVVTQRSSYHPQALYESAQQVEDVAALLSYGINF